MQHKRNFILALLFGTILVACHKQEHPGYDKKPSGLFVKSLKKGTDTIHAKAGERVTLQIWFRTEKDCVMIDTRKDHRALPVVVRPSGYPGDVFEAIGMLCKGDSTSFILDAKKYFASMKGVKAPPFIDSNSILYLDLKAEKIETKDVVEAEQRKQQEEQMKQQQEMQKMAEAAKDEEPKLLKKYIDDNKIKVKPTASGIYYIETQKGKGDNIKAGQLATVKYTGKFLDGQVFDSSERGGKPFEFHPGRHEVISGWDEAFLMMKKGGKATFVIPSSQAYGDGGGRMKPYATLVFDVELLDIRDAGPGPNMGPPQGQPGH